VFVPREPARQAILNMVVDALDSAGPGGTLRIALGEEGGSAFIAVECTGGDVIDPPANAAERIAVTRTLATGMGGRVEEGAAGGRVLIVPVRG
jgi:hypothetical protein